jgi:uncharacterized membrane protein YgaE (UPF0421/DUF939 family)
MEIIGKNIERLLDDLKQVTALLEDATLDVELIASEPYQEARLSALRQQLGVIKEQLQQLRNARYFPHSQSTENADPSFLQVGRHRHN